MSRSEEFSSGRKAALYRLYRGEGKISETTKGGSQEDPAGEAQGRWFTTSANWAHQYTLGREDPHIYEVEVDRNGPEVEHWNWLPEGDAHVVLHPDAAARKKHSSRCTNPGCQGTA